MIARAVGAAIVAAALLAGCSSQSPADAVGSALDKTIDEGSAHVVISTASDFPEELQVEPFSITGEGNFDFVNERGEGNFDFSEAPGFSGGTMGEGGVGEMVFEETVFFMKLPLFKSLFATDTEWIKFDPETLEQVPGVDAGSFAQLGQNDPSQVLGYLNGATDVSEGSEEDVEGVEATHYELTIDYERARAEAPTEIRPLYDSVIEDLGVTSSPGDVWIDSDGLVRKLTFEWTIDVGALQPGATGDVIQDVELLLSDHGVEVEVEVPPPSEVTDLAELLTGGG